MIALLNCGLLSRLYIGLRRSSKRFIAIQWLLAAEVSLLVPEEERRRSKISSMEECTDEELTEEDKRGHFCCFVKSFLLSQRNIKLWSPTVLW